MARASATVYLSGSSRAEGTSIRVTAPRTELGYWLGRGGVPEPPIRKVMERHARDATQETTREHHRETVDRIPKRTGRTARSVDHEVTKVGDHFLGRVWSDYFVARILEDGSGLWGPRRQLIRPRPPARKLVFPARRGGGFRLSGAPRTAGGAPDPRARMVFTDAVRGQPPQRPFERATRAVRPQLGRIYRRHAREAARELEAM